MSTFAPVGSSQISVVTEPNAGADELTIDNLVVTSGVEVSYLFPPGTRQYQVKARTGALEVRTVSGGNFYSLPRNCVWSEAGLNVTGLTLFLTSNADTIIEVLSWA